MVFRDFSLNEKSQESLKEDKLKSIRIDQTQSLKENQEVEVQPIEFEEQKHHNFQHPNSLSSQEEKKTEIVSTQNFLEKKEEEVMTKSLRS